VTAVQDGAEWLQPFVDYRRPDALRILDFAHAAEYVSEFVQLVFSWLQKELHTLKHEGPSQVLQDLSALQEQYPAIERLGEIMAYLRKHEAHMQYPTYQTAGWVRDGGECRYSGGGSPSHRSGPPLAATPCQSDAGAAQCRLQ
jgi:hypothetical protein